METGKAEYAPDYKSKKSTAAKLAIEIDKKLRLSLYEGLDRQRAEERIAAERSRLEREVIEAVRKWHHNDKRLTRIAIHLAMNALLDFESSQQQIKK